MSDPIQDQGGRNDSLAEIISLLFVAIVMIYLFLKILFF